jgi:catechol 2,3-dioxygenase-like lactoylglutathione lyase family enzyme
MLGHLGINVPDLPAAKHYYGMVIHLPQHFPQYPGYYYAIFWDDPFGLKLEAVCHHDRD